MLLLLLAVYTLQQHVLAFTNYTGHSVIRATPYTIADLQLLQDLHTKTIDDVTQHINFWKLPSRIVQPVDIQVTSRLLPEIQRLFQENNIDHRLMIENIETLIQSQKRRKRSAREQDWSNHVADITSHYLKYDEMQGWLNAAVQHCGHTCSVEEIGKSTENRPLLLFKIISSPGLPSVWIDAGIHAREWISPATALFFISRLIDGVSGTDSKAREMVEKFNWYILPEANPDGYVHSWTKDRLWRKTRSSNENSACKGTDANRNWNFYWGGHGTSTNPCAENYRGPYPFSEPETRAMANYMWSIRDNLKLYISFHSYGQYWLLPWGFSYLVPEDYNDLVTMGNEAIDLLDKKYNMKYEIGSASRMLYRAAGGSDDWAKGRARVKYSYTIELSDTGQHGFLLPPEYINATGSSIFDAIYTLAEKIHNSL